MAQWYYAKGGQQLGPVSDAELRQKIANREVQPSDMVWKDGMASWQAASSIPELAVGGAAPQGYAQPQQYAAPQQYAQPQGYAPQQYAPPGQYPAQPVGYGGYPQPMAAGSVPNYLVQSILVTLFCCMPLGVVGIVFAAQVNGKLASGDYAGALDSSKKAKQFSMWGAIGGGIVMVLYFGFVAIMIASQG